MTDGAREALRSAKIDRDTEYGAKLLARQVQEYWHARGYTAVRVEAFEVGANWPDKWGVRSNLVNGLPLAPVAVGRVK